MRQSSRILLHAVTFMTLLCVTLAAGVHAATNLLANPSFEAGGGSYAGYFTFGGGVQLSTPATDNIARTGATAAKLYGGFTGCPGTPSFSVNGFGQAFTPGVGKTYQFSGYSYIASVDSLVGTDPCLSNRMIAKIVFFDRAAGGNELQSNEIILANTRVTKNQWIPFSISTVAPTGALRVEALILYLQPGCAPGSAFVDDLNFEQDPTAADANTNLLANPGFTSALTGWSTFGNVFADGRAAVVHTRAGSAKLFSTFAPNSPSGIFQHTSATPGSKWEFGGYSLNTCIDGAVTGTNDNFLTQVITFRDAINNDIGTVQNVFADNTSPLGTWQRASLTATAPVGTVALDTYVLFNSPTLQGGAFFIDDMWLRRLDVAGVGQPVLSGLAMAPAAPNPFTHSTRLEYTLPTRGDVDLNVFDITGRRVATLYHGVGEAGSHVAIWDGRAADGRLAPAGVYRAVLKTATGRESRSLVLSR